MREPVELLLQGCQFGIECLCLGIERFTVFGSFLVNNVPNRFGLVGRESERAQCSEALLLDDFFLHIRFGTWSVFSRASVIAI